MKCLVFVKFLPGGALQPSEFLRLINAEWSCLEDVDDAPWPHGGETPAANKPRSLICIAEYEDIQQFSTDLTVMPGAGISNIEIMPVSGTGEPQRLSIN